MKEAMDFVAEKGKASVSMLQRRFRIGYNRAARMMEELESRGVVGPEDGVKPRKVLIPPMRWDD
jgi:S-DNA-T family DNA segregation ATPase FtsK/SpoIIIE